MNRTLNHFITPLLLSGLFTATAWAEAPPAPQIAPPPAKDFVVSAQPTTSVQDVDGVQATETQRQIDGVSSEMLGRARALYKNLLLTLHAAERRDQIDLRLGLNNADDIVDTLYQSPEMQALLQQSAIVREDLKRGGQTIDKELWLPLQAELETVRIKLPVERYQAAKSAIAQGIAAAKAGDRKTANAMLDEVEASLSERFALLPLDKIRADLRSAENSLDPEPPYWHGVSEAMQSALASIRWVTTVESNSWMSAYRDTVNAIKSASNQPDQARQWLRSAAARLRGLSGAGDLADNALTLSTNARPSTDAMYDLVDGIGAHLSNVGNS